MGFLFFFSPIQWYLPFSSQGLIESNCRKLEGSSVAAFLTKSRDPKSIKWARHSVSYVWNPSEVDAESVCVTPVLLQPVCSTLSGTVSKAFLYICCTNVHFKDGESAFTCSCFTFSLTAGWNWSDPGIISKYFVEPCPAASWNSNLLYMKHFLFGERTSSAACMSYNITTATRIHRSKPQPYLVPPSSTFQVGC